MLYRYTLTLDAEEDIPKKSLDALGDMMINGVMLIPHVNSNLKLEDEEAIQNNKKMLYKPIVNTIDVKFDPENEVSSSIKYLLSYVKQLENENQQESDFHNVLITAINTMLICKGEKVNENEEK